MRGAARAIGWELTRHHRLGLASLVAYLLVFYGIKAWVLGPETRIRLAPPNEIAALLILPFTMGYLYCVGAFCYGLTGDLASRESAFPRRMLTLPIGTLALAGWPMLYGTASCVGLWLLLAALSRWPGGADIELPWIWPAMLVTAFLVWMQALTWAAYPMRGMRIVVAVLLLTATNVTVLAAAFLRVSEATMVAILAPILGLAYVAGYLAVVQARRGDLPEWRMGSWAIAATAPPGTTSFKSPSRAQAWFEWRQHGRTLPALVAFVVPCELVLLFIPGNQGWAIVLAILVLVLVTPPGMALLAAPALGTFTTHSATRPLTSAQLVAAKLEMTAWSTLAAWIVTFALVAAGLWLSGATPAAVSMMDELTGLAGPWRATLVVAAVVAAAVAATWKNLVQSLCIGLTGRPGIIRASVLLAMAFIVIAFPVVWLVLENDPLQALVWDYVPWILAALVVLKVSAGSWVAIQLHDRKVLGDRALVTGAVAWLLAVAAVYGALAWLLASPLFPFYFVGAVAILVVPLARLSAAPLALAWSRHR